MINVPLKSVIQTLQSRGRLNALQVGALASGGLPNTLAAFQEAAQYARNYWAEAAMGMHFAGPFRMKSQYAEAIQASAAWNYPADGDPWHVIISPDQRIAAIAELFVPPYDMKPGILAGPNAIRHDKDGNIYKMIPFRHDPEKLPPGILDIMKEKAPTISSVKGTAIVENVGGNIRRTERKKYFTVQWGGRLEKDDLKRLDESLSKPGKAKRPDIFPLQTASGAPLREYQHAAPKVLGMVRVRQAYESAVHEQLMTWRYMGHKSPPWAWWHPGFQANPILQQILPHVEENFKTAVRAGLMEDIRAILGGS